MYVRVSRVVANMYTHTERAGPEVCSSRDKTKFTESFLFFVSEYICGRDTREKRPLLLFILSTDNYKALVPIYLNISPCFQIQYFKTEVHSFRKAIVETAKHNSHNLCNCKFKYLLTSFRAKVTF